MPIEPVRPEIRLSARENDCGDWFAENSKEGLKHLSQAVGYIKADEGLYHLRSALSYQIALVAAIEGFEEALDLEQDTALLLEEGHVGYLKFLKKYGAEE